MPEGPAIGGSWAQDYGAVTGSSIGTTVTASASTNTKGTAVELIAATAHDAHWISVTALQGATSGVTGLLDILIGSSTESVLIANLPTTNKTGNEGGGGPFLFPLFIPKGSRLAAAYQASTGSATVEVVVHLFGGNSLGPWADCSYVDRYGATTTSRGTAIDPGAVADTYVLAQITAATVRPIRWMVLCVQSFDTGITAAQQWTLQLMIGASTEQKIGGDMILTTSTNVDNSMPFMHWYFPVFIPTGSRLSVQAKCSIATAGDRVLNASLFGAG